MDEIKRPQINLTKNLPVQNYYTLALDNEFKDFAFNEERVLNFKGKWRSEVFNCADSDPLDLEIGTGNGVHFQHHCLAHPNRKVFGVEIKYKPLIQTIRGALKKGATNGKVGRFHAFNLDLVFAENEINNIYIHFPDPWTSPRKPKNRIFNSRMLDIFFSLQRSGSLLEFKTDSRELFLWSLENIKNSKYKIEFETLNLHQSEQAKFNIMTAFEKIFLRQGIEINYIRLRKD